MLIDEGYEVFSLVRHVAGRYRFLTDELNLVFGDLTDHSRIRQIVTEVDPEYIIHLAAKTPVSLSFTEPVDYWETIATATVNLAEAARSCENLKLFIHASTSEVYGTQKILPLKENLHCNPTSPYAVAKVAAERYLRMLRLVYDFPFIIVRPFNTYHRRKIKHYVVERSITTLIEKGEVQLWNPASIRDFLHVDDHARGYLHVLKKGRPGEIYNLCTGRGISIREMVDIVCKEVNEQFGIEPKVNWGMPHDRPYELKILVGDNMKAKEQLDWEPKISLEEGIKRSVRMWGEILGVNYK